MASKTLENTVVITYNCHGLNQSHPFLDDICSAGNAKIILVQEHWQTTANMSKILNFSSKYSGFGVSAMDSTFHALCCAVELMAAWQLGLPTSANEIPGDFFESLEIPGEFRFLLCKRATKNEFIFLFLSFALFLDLTKLNL